MSGRTEPPAGERERVPAGSHDLVAVRLTAQIDDLARALARAGVPLGEQARLLELASVAALEAVALEATHAGPPAAPAPVTPLSEAPSLRIAAA
jgi:hypothetical protein